MGPEGRQGAVGEEAEGAMTAKEFYRKVSRRKHLEKSEVLELLQLYMRERGLEGWTAQIYKVEPIVQHARCYWDIKMIWINEWSLDLSSPAKLRQTILHEIAHALVPDDFTHGELWRSKAIEIGVSQNELAATDQYFKEMVRQWLKRDRKKYGKSREELLELYRGSVPERVLHEMLKKKI